MEAQVVAVLDLGEEEPVLAPGLGALAGAAEGREGGEPLLPAGEQVGRGEGVREGLETTGVCAGEEGVGTLPGADPGLPQAVREPVVLVQAHAGRGGEVGAHAHGEPAPAPVVDVEVVLEDPVLRELQLPAIVFLIALGDQHAGGLPRLEDGDDMVRLGAAEVRVDEVIAAAVGGVEDGRTPLRRAVLDPVLVLLGDVA